MKIADLDATFVIDTREKCPYEFANPRIAVVRRKLPAGDYSIDGRDWEIAVERKSLDDYVQTIIKERDRFRAELRELNEYRAACIVVEASMDTVKEGGLGISGASPNAVFGATTSIIVDYGVPVYFCGDRQFARKFTEEFLLRWHLKLLKLEAARANR